MKISIIIPNYNGAALLKKNIPFLLNAIKQNKKEDHNIFEVIMVDDGSTDESVKQLAKMEQEKVFEGFADFRFIVNKKNMGFSSTVNRGANASTGEIIVLFNTDVRPEESCFHNLLRHFQDDSIFAVTCLDKSVENGEIVERGRGIGQWKKGFLYHSLGDLSKTNSLWASGGSSAFRATHWKKFSGMNELYNPFYWEDIDLSYRAQKAGLKVLFEKNSMVIHEHEKGAIRKSRKSKEINAIAYRNQIIFVWLNATDMNLILAHLFWMPYHIAQALMHGDSAFFIGLLQAFMRFPRILHFRRSSAKYNMVSDQNIVKEFRE